MLSKIPRFTRMELISPFVANQDLKISEYDTSDVAHGKNTQVLKNPFSFRSLLFKICASKIARINMIGTSIKRYKNVLPTDLMNNLSLNIRV